MFKRGLLLFCVLVLASCGSAATSVAAGESSDSSSAPDAESSETAPSTSAVSDTVEEEASSSAADDTDDAGDADNTEEDVAVTTTIDPAEQDPDPESFSDKELVEFLAADLVEDGNLQLGPAEEQCLVERLPNRLSRAEVVSILNGEARDLEPDSELVPAVVSMFEEIGACLGDEALIVALEPENYPEAYGCAVELYPSEPEQVDLGVAIFIALLTDVPPPDKYQAILDDVSTNCDDEQDESDDAPVAADDPFVELAELIAADGNDFDMGPAESQCLAEQLPNRISAAQAVQLLDGDAVDLDPDAELVAAVVSVFEEISGCVGGETMLETVLEPDFNPELHSCAVQLFPSEAEQVDLGTAVAVVEFAELPAPDKYQAVLDELEATCGDIDS